MAQGCLHHGSYSRSRFLRFHVAFHRVGEVVRESYCCSFHKSIISPIGESGDIGERSLALRGKPYVLKLATFKTSHTVGIEANHVHLPFSRRTQMVIRSASILCCSLLLLSLFQSQAAHGTLKSSSAIFGFRDSR